jgi:hypothetical protein
MKELSECSKTEIIVRICKRLMEERLKHTFAFTKKQSLMWHACFESGKEMMDLYMKGAEPGTAN